MSADQTGNPRLIALIRREIERKGPMSFERFMGLALYHPRYGYYASDRAQIGRHGDFYTNVSVGVLFGELLAQQFTEMWEKLERPKTFTLVEAGAHGGQLGADILGWLRGNRGDVFAATHYIIIEPSVALRTLQRSRLKSENVQWVKKIEDVRANSLVGSIFANELLDAFPVRRITMRDGQWREVCVGWRDGRFVTVVGCFCQAANQWIADSQSRPTMLPPQYSTEICPAAAQWTQAATRRLRRGWMLIFDYGYEEAEYYAPHRTDGTLICYHQHRANNEPLTRIGEQDITAHVNFTAIARVAARAGARVAGFSDQQHFVVAAAKKILSTLDARQIRAFQTLSHPNHLGRAMKLLALCKAGPSPTLSGLEYARKM